MLNDIYTNDTVRAVDAKFEAQKIAFAPLAFQAARALLELGILRAVSDSGDTGLLAAEAAEKTGISRYGVKVLLEMGLGMNLVKYSAQVPQGARTDGERGDGKDFGGERFVLGKTGWFLLEDEMTRVNLDFVNDVCYKGAFELSRSIRAERPEGLGVFGEYRTIYEALASLPDDAKKSWFAFDHFYSDIGFEEALPIVFSGGPTRQNCRRQFCRKIIDIGGNTARWAIRCCRYDPEVEVLIVDLAGQTAAAAENIAAAGFSERISTLTRDVLEESTVIPSGADVIWMSQFLDCFSPEQITRIMEKVRKAASASAGENGGADIYILEPFWDTQRFPAAAFSLQATSLYFTCMANGCSKMYRYAEFADAVEKAGVTIVETHHHLGSNDYSLLRCRSNT